ncbi:MAG: hypothetical protein JNL52_12170 [Flavobacteriales bacterium]|nr:hypothetical protein [Flavobacteriales bacterium]
MILHRPFVHLLALLLAITTTSAQDNQYWTQQNGARATLMGGAASASTDDQAVLFYNPAAARRVKGTGITASANFMYMQWLKVEDTEGLGIEASEAQSNNVPKLIVGSFDPKGNERLRISFGFVNNLYGRFDVRQVAAVNVESDAGSAGTELITGNMHLSTETREDLVGAGASYTLGAKSSIGLNLFASIFSQSYLQLIDLGQYSTPNNTDSVRTLAARSSTTEVEIFNLGLLPRFGYFHTGPRTQWGITVTAPRIGVGPGDGLYQQSTLQGSTTAALRKTLLYGNDLATHYRTPWMLDLGLETRSGTTIWAFRLGCATGLKAYDRVRLDASQDVAQGALGPAQDELRRVRSASIPVINVGVGAQFRLSDKADLLTGFRTDMNHLDMNAVQQFSDITANFSYWDLYHTSCGVDWHSRRAKFTAGLVWSMGRDTSEPRSFGMLGELVPALDDVRFRTAFNQLGFTFGISYFVLGDTSAKEPQP